ncbi:MAG: hypothetical protein ACAH17_02815 [Candidatus Paceibacterota bacterium]
MQLLPFEKTFVPAVVLCVVLMGLYEASFTGYPLNIGPGVTKAMLAVMLVGAGLILLSAIGAGMSFRYHGALLWGGTLGMFLLSLLFGGYAFMALYSMELYESAGILDASWYRSFQENWFPWLNIPAALLLARYGICERKKFV